MQVSGAFHYADDHACVLDGARWVHQPRADRAHLTPV